MLGFIRVLIGFDKSLMVFVDLMVYFGQGFSGGRGLVYRGLLKVGAHVVQAQE